MTKGTLKEGEFHPSAHIAYRYLKNDPTKLLSWVEPLASCAIEGNRSAEICIETLNRLINGGPVSDRYLMGLAWFIWELENNTVQNAN